jgi:enoyl-[acyl-carrier protein] reductase I
MCWSQCLCRYSHENAPMQKELAAPEVGAAAAFLVSPLASAITGSTVYVDNGLNNMALVGLRPSCTVLFVIAAAAAQFG